MYATTTLIRMPSGSSISALMILCFTTTHCFTHRTPAASSHISITPAVIRLAPSPSARLTPGVPHAPSPSPSVRYLAAVVVSSCFVSCRPIMRHSFSLKYALIRLALPVSPVDTPPSQPSPTGGKNVLSLTSCPLTPLPNCTLPPPHSSSLPFLCTPRPLQLNVITVRGPSYSGHALDRPNPLTSAFIIGTYTTCRCVIVTSTNTTRLHCLTHDPRSIYVRVYLRARAALRRRSCVWSPSVSTPYRV